MTSSAAVSQAERAPPTALKRGTRIAGRFELLKRIADGGMGSVWAARNTTTNADVAVKVLHGERDGSGKHNNRERDNHAAQRFRHEAQLGAKLAHRNITRVFDFIDEEEDGALVLVMELLRGQTLRTYYKAKRALSSTQAVAIVVPILSALQHAHEQGVIHRDLKPSNIFLHVDPDGVATPKLLDFGIAKAKDSTIETRTGDALGTPSYMSPEQVRAASLDARSDVFAVAVVLYEIIAGENPFQGSTATAALAQVLELEIDPHPNIEPRLWLEIRRALSKQAYERHASARALATALCAAVGETESSLAASLAQLDLGSSEDADVDAGADADGALEEGTEGATTLRDLTRNGPQTRRGPRALFKTSIMGVALVIVAGGALLLRSSFGSPVKTEAVTTTTQNQIQSQNDGTIDGGELAEQPTNEPHIGRTTPPKQRSPRHSTGRPASKASTSPSTSASLARTPGF